MLGCWLGPWHSVLHNGIEDIFVAAQGEDYWLFQERFAKGQARNDCTNNRTDNFTFLVPCLLCIFLFDV